MTVRRPLCRMRVYRRDLTRTGRSLLAQTSNCVVVKQLRDDDGGVGSRAHSELLEIENVLSNYLRTLSGRENVVSPSLPTPSRNKSKVYPVPLAMLPAERSDLPFAQRNMPRITVGTSQRPLLCAGGCYLRASVKYTPPACGLPRPSS